jgi:hypothetical protein
MTNLDKNTFQADITVIDLTADFTGSRPRPRLPGAAAERCQWWRSG